MTIILGLQIPNFSYGTGVENLFSSVVAQAHEAEAAGSDILLLMHHFYQLPMPVPLEGPMMESYTALGALASVTERLQLATMVSGVTCGNPALPAKIITTLDVVSSGREILGMGRAGTRSNTRSTVLNSVRSQTVWNAWKRQWSSWHRCFAVSVPS